MKNRPVTLLISKSGDHDFRHIKIQAMYRKKDDTIRNWNSDWSDPKTKYFDGLEITCQQDERKGQKPYGWDITYKNTYSIDLGKAEKLHKTLVSIHKKMENTSKKYGSPSCFADYVIRVFHAIGADSFCWISKQSNSTWLHENEYVFSDVDSGKYRIESLIVENNEELTDKNLSLAA